MPSPMTVMMGTAAFLQRMPEQDLDLDLALGAGRADVILAEDLDNARPRHAGDERDVDDRQGHGRQDQALHEAAEAGADRLITLDRQPVQLDGEDVDEEVTDHEDRHREAEHRETHDDAVDPGALLVGGEHAERHRDDDGNGDRT